MQTEWNQLTKGEWGTTDISRGSGGMPPEFSCSETAPWCNVHENHDFVLLFKSCMRLKVYLRGVQNGGGGGGGGGGGHMHAITLSHLHWSSNPDSIHFRSHTKFKSTNGGGLIQSEISGVFTLEANPDYNSSAV